MFGDCYTLNVAVFLLIGYSFGKGQDTNVGLGTCRYTFAVQSRLCTPDPMSKAAMGEIQDTVAQLRNQMAQLASEIATMKRGKGMTYVYLGCPDDITIDVVNYVPIAIKPALIQMTSVNISEVDDFGERVLIQPLMRHFPVFCTVDKYIVIQRRRAPYELSFTRNWNDYKNGFGDVRGEFWLGLEKIHKITNQPFFRFSLRIEAKLANGMSYYAEYNNFFIGNETQKYIILSIGNAIAKTNYYFLTNGTIFATADKDQKYRCGSRYNGFWYFENMAAGNIGCSHMTMNADPPYWRGYTPAFTLTEMKIRPLRT